MYHSQNSYATNHYSSKIYGSRILRSNFQQLSPNEWENGMIKCIQIYLRLSRIGRMRVCSDAVAAKVDG